MSHSLTRSIKEPRRAPLCPTSWSVRATAHLLQAIMSDGDAAMLLPVPKPRGYPSRLFLLTLLFASCSLRRTTSTPAAPHLSHYPIPSGPATASLSPAPGVSRLHRVGILRVIGAGSRFVLIETPSAGTGALPDGQVLQCANSAGSEPSITAVVRVGRERRPPFVVADVVSGDPQVGDIAYLAPAAVPIAPMVLPTSTSGVLPIVLPTSTPGPRTTP